MTPGQARIALLSFLARDDRRGGECAVPADQICALPPRRRSSPPGGCARPPTAAASRARPRASTAPSPARPKPRPRSRRCASPASPRIRPSSMRRCQAPQGDAGIETVRAIQRELKSRGYGPLAGDGVMGLATRAGIMAFEYDHGLGLTGEASEELLKRILLGAPPDIGACGRGENQVGPGRAGDPRRAAAAGGARLSRCPRRRLARRGHRQGHPRVRDGQGARAQGPHLRGARGAPGRYRRNQALGR